MNGKPAIHQSVLLEFVRQNPNLTSWEISQRFPTKRYRSDRMNHHDLLNRLDRLLLYGQVTKTDDRPPRWCAIE